MYTPEYAGHPFRILNYAHPLAKRLAISCSGYNRNRWTGVTIYKNYIPQNARRKIAISSAVNPFGINPLVSQYAHRKGGAFVYGSDTPFLYIYRYALGYSDIRYYYALHQPPNFPPDSETVATDRIYVQYYLVFSGVNIVTGCGLSYPDNNFSLSVNAYLSWGTGLDVIRFYVGYNIVYTVSAPLLTRPSDKKVLIVTFLLDPIQPDNTKNYLMKAQILPSRLTDGTPNPVFSYSNHWNVPSNDYPPYYLLRGFVSYINSYSQQNEGFPFYHGLLVLDHSKYFSSFAEVDLFPTANVARELIRTSGQDLWLKPSDLIPGIFTYEVSGLSITDSDSKIAAFNPYQSFGTADTSAEVQAVNRLTIRGSGAATTYSLGQFYNLLLSTLLYSNPQTLSIANVEAAPIYIAGILGQTNTESRLPMTVLIRPSGLLTTQTQVLATNSVWLKSAIIGYTETVAFYGDFGRGQDIYLTTGTGAAISSFSKLYDRLGGDAESETTSLFISRVYLTPAIQAETLSAADIYQSQIILSYFAGRTTTSLEARISPAFGYLTAFGGPRSSSSVNLEPSQIIQSTGTLQSSTESRLGTGVYVVSSHLLAAHESVFLPYFPSLCIVSAFPVTLTLGEQQYRLTERLSGAAETATVSLPITEGISGIAVQAETGGILTESYVTVNLIQLQYPGLGWYKDQTVTQIII